MHELLREDVERGQHPAVGDERQRERVQRRIVRRPAGPLDAVRRPGLAVQRQHLIAQCCGQIVLRVGEDSGSDAIAFDGTGDG